MEVTETVQLLLPTAPAGVTAGLSSATLTEAPVPPVTLRPAGVWGTPTVLSGPPTALHLDSAEKLNGLELAEDNYYIIQYQEKTRIMIVCGIDLIIKYKGTIYNMLIASADNLT